EANGSMGTWWDAYKHPPAQAMTWQPRFQRIANSPLTAAWDAYACSVGNPEMELP
ncbi:hypothetical protein HX776_18410, partial [Pseudomonas agarici]|nr:hypothetical protein [Pseudomonas agarici]